MTRPDVRLYLVTDPSFDDLERVVVEGVEGGVTCVQVRDKRATPEQVERVVARLRSLLTGSGVPVLSNDVAVAGDGVHVGVSDTPPHELREAVGPGAVIGWSVNALDQLDHDPALEACDYVAASPVFVTPTKTDTSPPFGLDGVRALHARLDGRVPLVGIGGIDETNVVDVVRAGADGVAVVRAVGAALDPRAAAKELRSRIDAALADRGALG